MISKRGPVSLAIAAPWIVSHYPGIPGHILSDRLIRVPQHIIPGAAVPGDHCPLLSGLTTGVFSVFVMSTA